MYIDGNSDETSDAQSLADLLNNTNNIITKAAKEEPEVVCFKNMDMLEEVRFEGDEEDELISEPLLPTMLLSEPVVVKQQQQQQPVRLVMKLPKKAEGDEEEEEAKPVKLKLKLTTSVEPKHHNKNHSKSSAKSSKKQQATKPSEDDEMIKDLKNAYCDDDFGRLPTF